MTQYFVSPHGSDSNNGLGPDPAHATNKPWLTLAKALGAAGIASGDSAQICPGTYRETVTVAMTSATVETIVHGDVDNSSGFKDGSGNTVPGGDIIWTAYTTNDTTNPSTSRTLSATTKDYLTFENILFIGGNLGGSCVSLTTSENCEFSRCVFIPGAQGATFNITPAVDIASNLLLDSCVVIAAGGNLGINLAPPTSTTADYDLAITIKNCLLTGGSGGGPFRVTPSGANSFKPGGVTFYNCTIWGGSDNVNTQVNSSTTHTVKIYNSVLFSGNVGLNANASGQIVEDYNIIYAATPRTNVTAGANSKASSPFTYALLWEAGQAEIAGRLPRPWLMPMKASPLLGFGNQSGSPDVDFLNRPRPAGGENTAKGIGYLERHDTAARETSTVRTGSNAIVITGPGDHDFAVPVDAVATTLSIYGRYDTNHATTNKPQMKVLNGGECGVADATATMTAAVDTWEQLSLTFTPTRQGIVTIRLISRSAANTGKAFFDDFAKT